MVLDRVDEDADVVEQRPLGLARIAGNELEVGAADLQPPSGAAAKPSARQPATAALGSAEYSAT